MGKMAKLKKLLHATFYFAAQLINFIDEEIANAKAGRKAQIIVKVNALTEVQLINKLYELLKQGSGRSDYPFDLLLTPGLRIYRKTFEYVQS